MSPEVSHRPVGVVVLAYNAEAFLTECLESLLTIQDVPTWCVIVDNNSSDATESVAKAWLDQRPADDGGSERVRFSYLRNADNLGFAGGVNVGIKHILANADVAAIWILNPDTVVEPDSLGALLRHAEALPNWGIVGSRILFLNRPGIIQADGGVYRKWMGFAKSVNIGKRIEDCFPPADHTLDYIPGVSMLVSLPFIRDIGLMDETWFLYFEEIDWAFRRKNYTLSTAPNSIVKHRAGASIGSGSGGRTASPLSVYFTYRNLIRFSRRWTPYCLPTAYVMAWAMLIRRYWRHPKQFVTGLRGLHGLSPPRIVRQRLPTLDWGTMKLAELATMPRKEGHCPGER